MKRILIMSLGFFYIGVEIGKSFAKHMLEIVRSMLPTPMTNFQIAGFSRLSSFSFTFWILGGIFTWMLFMVISMVILYYKRQS